MLIDSRPEQYRPRVVVDDVECPNRLIINVRASEVEGDAEPFLPLYRPRPRPPSTFRSISTSRSSFPHIKHIGTITHVRIPQHNTISYRTGVETLQPEGPGCPPFDCPTRPSTPRQSFHQESSTPIFTPRVSPGRAASVHNIVWYMVGLRLHSILPRHISHRLESPETKRFQRRRHRQGQLPRKFLRPDLPHGVIDIPFC